MSGLYERAEAADLAKRLKREGKKLVFTNGCFDIIHSGHVGYLSKARYKGDYLFVGLNSDRSVKSIKGEARPVFNEKERAEVLLGLSSVDSVVIFEEEDPLELIKSIIPDILVKGGDWEIDNIVGRDFVESAGGKVMNMPISGSSSTTSIIEKAERLGKR